MGRDFPGDPAKILPTNAGGVGSIPGRGTKIPHASQLKNQNIKQKQYYKKFNKDLKKKKKMGKKCEQTSPKKGMEMTNQPMKNNKYH